MSASTDRGNLGIPEPHITFALSIDQANALEEALTGPGVIDPTRSADVHLMAALRTIQATLLWAEHRGI